MREETWGERAALIIGEVISENRGLPEREMRRRISSAWPWGERKHFPYKAWLREVRLALRREYGTGQGTRFSEERQEALGL